MSLYVTEYFDLDRQALDFNPIVINEFGSIGLRIKFHCQLGKQRVSSGIYAYPNNSEPLRVGTVGQAFTHLKRNGQSGTLTEVGPDAQIRPCVGIDKAVYLKPRVDAWNARRNRNPRFIYKEAIITPYGDIDMYGWYDGLRPRFDFRVKPTGMSSSARFKEFELDKSFAFMKNYMQTAKTPAWMEGWIEEIYPRQALIPPTRKPRKRGQYGLD